MSKIKVAMLPLDIRQADPAGNIGEVERMAGCLDADTDLLVLPELFTTGFIREKEQASRLAESTDGPSMTALRGIARRHDVAIAGSLICRADDGTLRNRAFFINPDAADGCGTTYYDKHHLFVLSDEKCIFEAGDAVPPVTAFRSWNIAITVCYDLRFPVWMRNNGNRYDMMIVPANWPDSRAYAWRTLLAARAIENQAAYVGIDRSGSDDFGTYSPDLTAGFDELGMPVTECRDNMMRYAVFSLDKINTLRHRFPVHLNADLYKL